ncbi:hypothetical protein CDAR_381671 [Caerostris darwini]|uniref:Uncharacterized protein n=1 Tax=Caerostris darwini TaxID=1538125 RepID=A0AAV4V5E9_9ARAC|nr:hypothetical protein CDAR_381671 [Caerostris darwini]
MSDNWWTCESRLEEKPGRWLSGLVGARDRPTERDKNRLQVTTEWRKLLNGEGGKKSQGDEEAEGDTALRRGHHAGKAALSCDPSLAHCHRHVVPPP